MLVAYKFTTCKEFHSVDYINNYVFRDIDPIGALRRLVLITIVDTDSQGCLYPSV